MLGRNQVEKVNGDIYKVENWPVINSKDQEEDYTVPVSSVRIWTTEFGNGKKGKKLRIWEELEVTTRTKSLFNKYDGKYKYIERQALESPFQVT